MISGIGWIQGGAPADRDPGSPGAMIHGGDPAFGPSDQGPKGAGGRGPGGGDTQGGDKGVGI